MISRVPHSTHAAGPSTTNALHERRSAATAPAPALDWHASAAYLYLLRLDSVSLAWEYLRRNPQYRQDWDQRSSVVDKRATAWHLAAFEDPALDARNAHPLWWPQAADVVRLTQAPATWVDAASRFSIWPIPGRKTLWHDGGSLILCKATAATPLRIAVPDSLAEGDPFAYLVRVDARAQARWRRIRRCDALLRAEGSRSVKSAMPVDRVALAHLRSLQALDGVEARASQRQIARVLFGASRVDQDWHADGELRAQVRYLIQRGQALMRGGYADLVTGAAHRPARGHSCAERRR